MSRPRARTRRSCRRGSRLPCAVGVGWRRLGHGSLLRARPAAPRRGPNAAPGRRPARRGRRRGHRAGACVAAPRSTRRAWAAQSSSPLTTGSQAFAVDGEPVEPNGVTGAERHWCHIWVHRPRPSQEPVPGWVEWAWSAIAAAKASTAVSSTRRRSRIEARSPSSKRPAMAARPRARSTASPNNPASSTA